MLIVYQAFPTAVFERVIENSDTAYTSSMESTLFHDEKNSALGTCDLPSGTSARRCELSTPSQLLTRAPISQPTHLATQGP